MAKTTRQTSIFGVEDWKRIYSLDQEDTEGFSSVDYPGAYENKNESY